MSKQELDEDNADLVLEGLDTYATVELVSQYLNYIGTILTYWPIEWSKSRRVRTTSCQDSTLLIIIDYRTNNMFVSYRTPVKSQLKEGQNDLVIIFPSTFIKGRQLEEKNGKFALWNGDSSRLHVRKAQYKYV